MANSESTRDWNDPLSISRLCHRLTAELKILKGGDDLLSEASAPWVSVPLLASSTRWAAAAGRSKVCLSWNQGLTLNLIPDTICCWLTEIFLWEIFLSYIQVLNKVYTIIITVLDWKPGNSDSNPVSATVFIISLCESLSYHKLTENLLQRHGVSHRQIQASAKTILSLLVFSTSLTHLFISLSFVRVAFSAALFMGCNLAAPLLLVIANSYCSFFITIIL